MGVRSDRSEVGWVGVSLGGYEFESLVAYEFMRSEVERRARSSTNLAPLSQKIGRTSFPSRLNLLRFLGRGVGGEGKPGMRFISLIV